MIWRVCFSFNRREHKEGTESAEMFGLKYHRGRYLFPGIVFTLVLIFPHLAHTLDVGKISEEASKSIVFIKTDRGAATGFFINAYGTIATCYHVIHKAKWVKVRWKDKFADAEIIYIEKAYDQALLNILERDTPYVRIQKHIVERIPDQLIKKGTPLLVMGYPFGREELVKNKGKTGKRHYRYEGGKQLSGVIENVTYETDMLVNPGNSGSPVFNADGVVIGMATAKVDTEKIKNAHEKSFINSVDKLFDRNRLLFQSAALTQKKVLLCKELAVCEKNTNPYYFRYADCQKDVSASFYYDCPSESYETKGYNDLFAGSFFNLPLYTSCKATIIPRHFPKQRYSKKLYRFMKQLA
ncbi:MAG: hypothetical protein DRI57_12185, partial [Deltaproteobacteria bacterium]